MNRRQSLGRWGESLAAEYLQSLGYTILSRNLRTPYGEIDLVARLDQPPTIVFVEVKARISRQFGPPEEAVDFRKQAHLRAAVDHYLQQHPEEDADLRLDVISIQRYKSGEPPVITHFENALS